MILYWSIVLAVFIFDFTTKSLIREKIPFGSEIAVLPFFSINHVGNTGVAFGLFQGRNTFFLIFGLIVVIVFLVWGIKALEEDKFFAYIIALISGGAAGNILDRMLFGRVTDFLDFYVGGYHWPSFNVADSAICIGAGLLMWHNIKKVKDQKETS